MGYKRIRRPIPGETAMFARTLEVTEDWRWLAPDRPAYQCMGGAIIIIGPNLERHVHQPCGRILPDYCFRPVGHLKMPDHRPVRARCIACEQEIRTVKSRYWFWELRAARSLRAHMRKERKQGLHQETRLEPYLSLGQLTVKQVANAMRAAEANDTACPHCGKAWSQMPGGAVEQMTLDRIDTSRLLAHDNYTLKCRTGNSQHGTTEPRAQQVRDTYWRKLRERGDA